MAKTTLIFLFFSFFIAANSEFLKNPFTALGDDPQQFEGLIPTIFRAYSNRDNVVEDIVLRYYTGKSIDQYTDVKLPQGYTIVNQPSFKKEYTTVFYVHGYKETAQSESVETVVKAYLEAQPNTNIVFVDWSNMAMGSYFINAAPNTRKVAHTFAAQLKKMIDAGLDVEHVHVVGHSLGGQIAGFIGNEMQKLDVKLVRITALDPAMPLYYPGFVMSHISKDDASFVDVIHTDAGAYGAFDSTGTVDFWPNGGKRFQPGCPTGLHSPMSPEDLCNHWRSWRFWAESLRNPEAFPAAFSPNHDKFEIVKNAEDGNSDVVYMGFAANPSAHGDYYLTTNAVSPYGKGMSGISSN